MSPNLSNRARPLYQRLLAKHRFKCPETSVDVHIITAGAHQANTPLLSRKLAEACTHLDRVVQLIKSRGVMAGAALNPHTPETVLDYVLDELDMVLVMSVNPGFGGQSLIERVFPKIERIRAEVERRSTGRSKRGT